MPDRFERQAHRHHLIGAKQIMITARHKQARIWIVAILLVLAAFAVFISWPFQAAGDGTAKRDNIEEQTIGSHKKLETAKPVHGAEVGSSVDSGGTRPATDKPKADMAAGSTEADEDHLKEVHILVLDQQGIPIPHLPIDYSADPLLNQQAAMFQGIIDTSWLTARLDRRTVTGANGSTTISASQPASVWLYLDSPGLAFVGSPPSSPFVLPLNSWHLSPTEVDVVLYCARSAFMSIEFKYEDGAPATGTLLYSVWTGPGEGRGMNASERQIMEPSTVAIERLPPDARIWGHILCERKGYAYKTVFRFDIREGHSYVVTVPRSTRVHWGVQVDLSSIGRDRPVLLRLTEKSGLEIAAFTQIPQQSVSRILRSVNLAPEDDFQLTVAVGDTCWTSPILRLRDTPGTWRMVVPDLQPSVTAVLKVVDHDGHPIAPAVVYRDHRSYLDSTVSTTPSERQQLEIAAYAVSDTDGRVSFGGLASGHHKLSVQAAGYFHKVIDYSATPGATVDLGSIVLDRVSANNGATVVVALAATTEYSNYEVQLGSPSGIALRSVVGFAEDGTAEMGELDHRSFRVTISEKSENPKRWVRMVDVSEGRSVQRVEVDVSK